MPITVTIEMARTAARRPDREYGHTTVAKVDLAARAEDGFALVSTSH